MSSLSLSGSGKNLKSYTLASFFFLASFDTPIFPFPKIFGHRLFSAKFF
jgi:hypothetical protein